MNSTAALIALVCLLGAPALAAISKASASEVLEPFVFTSDFESGSVGLVVPIPPRRTRPTIPPSGSRKVEGNDGLCLVREITPYNTDAHVFGVRRKIRMTLDGSSRLAFRYYVKSYTGAREIVVRLGFFDGTSRELSVPVPSPMTWNQVDMSLSSVLDAGGVKPLEAVAILAVCPSAIPRRSSGWPSTTSRLPAPRQRDRRRKAGRYPARGAGRRRGPRSRGPGQRCPVRRPIFRARQNRLNRPDPRLVRCAGEGRE